eukprot:m.77217 g.77217  ORF g.77217 m.77217 type:complete len:58 (-) comp8538_c0_seq2:497-670(-)
MTRRHMCLELVLRPHQVSDPHFFLASLFLFHSQYKYKRTSTFKATICFIYHFYPRNT